MSRFVRSLEEALRKDRHASGQEILSYLDGELSPRQMDWVRRHLVNCWSCRAAAEKVGQTVAGFVEFRLRSLEAVNVEWPPLEPRLRQAPEVRPPKWRSLLLSVGAAGCLALAIVVLPTGSSPVSASTILESARRVERAGTATGSVSYRKLTVLRVDGAHAAQKATFEVWADGRTTKVRHSGAQPLFDEMQAVLAANQRREPPLSAGAFEEWRKNLRQKTESVATSRVAGDDVFLVTTKAEGPLATHRIREDRIAIRRADWRPVAERMAVEGEGRVFEFEAVEQRLVDRAAAFGVEGAPPPPASKTAPVPRALHTGETSPAKPESGLLAEISAHYAVHKTGACLDGAVEVVSRHGEVTVRGVVGTAQEKSELEAELFHLEGVKADLETAGSLASADAGLLPAPGSTGEAVTVQPRPSVWRDSLRDFFTANPEFGPARESEAKFANQAILHTRDLRRHAWALRRLAERFHGEAGPARSGPAQWLLESMLRDHAAALSAEADSLRRLLDPFLAFLEPGNGPAEPPEPSPSSWAEAVSRAFSSQREIETLVHELLGDGTESGPGAAPAQRLRNRLDALRQCARQIAGLSSQEVVP